VILATEDSASTTCSNPAQVTLKYKSMNNASTLSHVEIYCVLFKSKAGVKWFFREKSCTKRIIYIAPSKVRMEQNIQNTFIYKQAKLNKTLI